MRYVFLTLTDCHITETCSVYAGVLELQRQSCIFPNESSVPFRSVKDGIACTPPRLSDSEVVPNVASVGLTA